MWTIILIDDGNIQVLETFIDDAEAVDKYKAMVENRHAPSGGYPWHLDRRKRKCQFLIAINQYI
jgi:hypothetical protein